MLHVYKSGTEDIKLYDSKGAAGNAAPGYLGVREDGVTKYCALTTLTDANAKSPITIEYEGSVHTVLKESVNRAAVLTTDGVLRTWDEKFNADTIDLSATFTDYVSISSICANIDHDGLLYFMHQSYDDPDYLLTLYRFNVDGTLDGSVEVRRESSGRANSDSILFTTDYIWLIYSDDVFDYDPTYIRMAVVNYDLTIETSFTILNGSITVFVPDYDSNFIYGLQDSGGSNFNLKKYDKDASLVSTISTNFPREGEWGKHGGYTSDDNLAYLYDTSSEDCYLRIMNKSGVLQSTTLLNSSLGSRAYACVFPSDKIICLYGYHYSSPNRWLRLSRVDNDGTVEKSINLGGYDLYHAMIYSLSDNLIGVYIRSAGSVLLHKLYDLNLDEVETDDTFFNPSASILGKTKTRGYSS